MLIWFYQTDAARPSSETPSVVAATVGWDEITRRRFASLGKELGVSVSFKREAFQGTDRLEIFVPEKDADLFARTYLKDEDLNANAICLRWMTLKDRFFSLPPKSTILAAPFPSVDRRDATKIGGVRLGSVVSRVHRSPRSRRLEASGYSLSKLTLSVRPMSMATRGEKGFDAVCLYANGRGQKTIRVQIVSDRLVDCGVAGEWPRDYAHGLVNGGSTKGAISSQ